MYAIDARTLQKELVGKTFTLEGTFNSNGEMIFGKRVKIKGVR